MAKQTMIKADLSDLQKVVKELGKDFYVKVGILGADAAAKHMEPEDRKTSFGEKAKGRKASATPSPFTNAEIGVIHEFGSKTNNIPQRSFLRMPIEEKKRDLIRFLGSGAIQELLTAGNIKMIFKRLGVEAEGIIQDAFRSRGFGQWAKNSDQTIKMKGSDAPLIDTGALRRSITSQVVNK